MSQQLGSMVEPLDEQYCPTCGQPKPVGFATGTRSRCPDPSVRYPDAIPDADGPDGYAIISRLAAGETAAAIADSMDMTLAQVEGLRPHIGSARNIKRGVRY